MNFLKQIGAAIFNTLVILFMLIVVASGIRQFNDEGRLVTKTDVETGCQYLENSKGGLTPRLGVDYMPMGCKGYADLSEVVE